MADLEVTNNQGLPPASPIVLAAPNLSASSPGNVMKANGVDSLGESEETQTPLEEDPEEQERQRWIQDGRGLWRQELGKQDLPDEFGDPAPQLTDLEKHRKRVRILLDENSDGTRNWDRVPMPSKEKVSEDQEFWSEYGNRVSFGGYNGEHNMPASDPNDEAQQQRPNNTRTTLRGGHLKTTNLAKAQEDLAEAREDLAKAQEMDNMPKIENGTRLIYTPGVLTVEQAEIFAHLMSVGLRPKFVNVEKSAFQYAGHPYNHEGYRIQAVPTKRSTEREPMMSVDGPVPPWGAEPHDKVGTDVEPAAMAGSGGTQGGTTSGRGRAAKGGATTRARGSMGKGGGNTGGRATTRGGGEIRGRSQTEQIRPGQTRRSSNPQGPSTMLMHGSSVTTGQNSRNVYLQGGETQRPSIEQPTGIMNGHVQANGILQGRPSGFMPMTMIQGDQLQGPQQQCSVPAQSQQYPTITSAGPIPGTSYTFPLLEEACIPASLPQYRGHQQAFPIPTQQPPISHYGAGRHGEYNLQRTMPPSAERGPQQSLLTPPQRPAMSRATPPSRERNPHQFFSSPWQQPAIPRAMPALAGSDPQQSLPTPPQRPANLSGPATAPALGSCVQPNHHEGRAGSRSGQPIELSPREGGSQRAPLVRHPQAAVSETGVVDFAIGEPHQAL